MIRTLPGIHTGTVDEWTDKSHEHFRFQPQGSLSLMTNEPHIAESLPPEIAANPGKQQLLEEVSGSRAPWYTRWFNVRKRVVKDSARLFIGFNVNANNGDLVHKWQASEVYQACYLLRKQQLEDSGLPPAFSYYTGLGAFPGVKGVVVAEKSAQVIFMNFSQSGKSFFDDMINLASIVADRLHQESVMLELSDKRGVFFLDYVEYERHLSVDETLTWLENHKNEFDEEVIKIR